jgi:hypothetical protein
MPGKPARVLALIRANTPDSRFDAFSSREPVPTSLENAALNARFWPHPCPAAATIEVRKALTRRPARRGSI